MTKADITDKYAARVLMVSFFLPARWQVFVAGGVSVYFVFRTLAAKQWPQKRNLLSAFFLGSVFFLYLFSVVITSPEYRKVLWHIVEREESLLLMPLVFGIISPYFRELIVGERIYFVYACLISCVAGNADYIYHYLVADHGKYPVSHVRYRMIFEAFTGFHPTYMSLFLGFSICILLLSEGFNRRYGVAMKYIFIYILLLLLLSLFAKSPMIAILIIFLHFAYTRRAKLYRYKWLISATVLSVFAVSFSIPFFRQRMAEVIQFSGKNTPASSATNSFYDREMIFNTDVAILQQYWLTGVGPGRMLRVLKERYFFNSLANETFVGYFDPHNQYFAIWLSFGILGIVVFLFILASHYIRAIRHADYLHAYLLIMVTVTFFTETLLNRQQGIVFYAVFTSLFFFRDQKGGRQA